LIPEVLAVWYETLLGNNATFNFGIELVRKIKDNYTQTAVNTALSISLDLSDHIDAKESFDILLISTYILHQIQFGREVFVRPTRTQTIRPSSN
jgi:hypothetical protein